MLKSKIISLAAAAAVAVTALPGRSSVTVSSAENPDADFKIMPIGDSITHGYEVDGGYRRYLSYFLSQKGYDIDFVGPNGNYPETFDYNGETVSYDGDHCGYSGYAIQYMTGTETRQGILETLQSGNYLATYQPDIVLLQIGTNDILSAYNDGITDRLENLVNYILGELDADDTVFVSTIPDIDVAAVYDWFWAYGEVKYNNTLEEFEVIIQDYIDEYNASIPTLVAKLQSEGKNVRFADINSVIDKDTDLKDGVHPHEQGYEKMGTYWCGVLDSFLGGSGPAVTTTTSAAPVTTTSTSYVPTTTTPVSTTASTTGTTSISTTTSYVPTTTTPVSTTTSSAAPETTTTQIDVSYGVYDLVNLSNYLLGAENNITVENWEKYDKDMDRKLTVYDLAAIREILCVHYY